MKGDGRMIMDRLDALYPQAIEHTKLKVFEDIDRFLEVKTEPPSFNEYKKERFQYLGQIWFNI